MKNYNIHVIYAKVNVDKIDDSAIWLCPFIPHLASYNKLAHQKTSGSKVLQP